MRRRPFLCVVVLWSAGLAVLSGRADTPPEYVWNLPRNFPRPRVPATNPMSEAKAELGRFLFYDTRLSGNNTQACATCHEQERAFTDGRAQVVGSTGRDSRTRGAPVRPCTESLRGAERTRGMDRRGAS